MFGSDPLSFGVALAILAVVFAGVALLLLRAAPRILVHQQPSSSPLPSLEIPASDDAVLLVEIGGRVRYTNAVARDWFGYADEEPNLERLARRSRPSDLFLGLCASEGQARFSLDGRLIEGTSYFVPASNGRQAAYLVSLRRPQVASIASGETDVSEHTLHIFAELSQTMASSLDLDTTLRAILESVERLIPSDFPEITIWDPVNKHLVPYHFLGMPGVDRHLEQSSDRYMAGKGYSGYLISARKPLMINDVDTFREVRPSVDRKQYPFNSYLGLPLVVAGELIGTLELASLGKQAFNEADLEVLNVLSGQAAVALHNAIQFQEEQRRILELSGLAKLAQAAGLVRETKDFFARLIEGIEPLLDAQTIGFLTYDESRRKLQARAPFKGIPAEFVELYQVPIPPGSPAEEVLLSQEVLIAPVAPEDERLIALDLAHLAQAAGIQNTVLMPLTSVGRVLGYLQVADKRDGQPFSQDDLRVLTIIAGQAATVIENATLVRQSQERAQRSEAMRRIASLTGSVATVDEILSFSLRELVRLLRADAGAIFLLDENRAELRVHKESLYGIEAETVGRLGRISMNEPDYRLTITATQRPFFSDDLTAETLPTPAYLSIADAFGMKSAIIVPIVIREHGIGEVLLGSRETDFFDRSDLIQVSTTASQLAAAVEKSTLYTQTDESLRRRVDQLLALTRVSRELNTNLKLEYLLQLVYDELLNTTQASCGTISLYELVDRSVEKPRMLLSLGDPAGEQLSALERLVLEQAEPIIVDDYDHPDEALGSDLKPPHEGIRSSLLVPIAYQDDLAGLIHLHSRNIGRFDMTALEIAQSLATQASIAIGNAIRFQEQKRRNELLSQRVETMSKLVEAAQVLSPDQPLDVALEAIAYGIQESTPFNVVLISVYEAEGNHLIRMAGAGLPLETMEEFRQRPQPWDLIQTMLDPQFKYGYAYFIPFEKRPVTPADLHTVTVLPLEQTNLGDEFAWHPKDFLLIPLFDKEENPLGMISVDAPRNGLRPDRPTLETLGVFASQAALTIQSHKELRTLETRARELEDDIVRARQAAQASQSYLPALLHKDLEQTIAIQGLSLRGRRIQAGLDIAELVNRQASRADVLQTFGREVLTRMDMDLVLVGEISAGGPHLLYTLGAPTSPGLNIESLLGQRNPLRSALQGGEIILVSSIDEGPDWKNSPLLTSLEAKAFISLPILVDEKVDAAILAISRSPMNAPTAEDQHLYNLLCRQAAIALENLRLLNETNRRLQEVNLLLEFSRQLGTLDSASILRTLVDSALQVVPAAHAGMVAIWQAERECLVAQAASGYIDNTRILEIPYRSGQALPGQAFERGEALRVDEVDFARDYNLPPESLLIYRDATEGRLPVSSLVLPIQAGDNKLGVLVLDNFKASAAFTVEDQALIFSLARQTALTLENVRLYQASEQRSVQLLALTQVAGTITSSLQTTELINSLLDQAKNVLPYDTGTLWLRQGDKLTVRAARGFEDSDQRIGLSVAVADSLLLKEMVDTSQPLYVGDVREDPRFPSLIEHQYLSWLGVPLISQGEVVGVIALEKTETNFYTKEHIVSAVTFAGQAAVGLVNANLYEESVRRAAELDERTQRLSLLNRLSGELSGSLDVEYILGVAIGELSRAVPCSVVSGLLFDAENHAFIHAETPQFAASYPVAMPENAVYERIHESLGIYSAEDVSEDSLLESLQPFFKERSTRALLVLPLASGNNLHGLALIQAGEPYRYSADEVEMALTIGNQAAVAIQNARLFAETERLFAETQQRSSELSTLFDLGVNITQVLDQQKLIDTTFDNTIRLLKADSVGLVMTGDTENLVIRALDQGEKVGPMTIPRSGGSFSEYVLQTGEPLIIHNMDVERETLPVKGFTIGSPVKSWLGVPLIVRGTTSGVLSVQSYHPFAFGEAQVRLISQVGNQLAVALDNARLFETVQNYAADLAKRVSERTQELEIEHNRTQTLLNIITELSASLDLDLVLNRTLAVLNEAISAEHSLIMLMRPDEEALYLRASLGYTTPPPKGGKTSAIKPNQGLAGWVLANRQATLVPDLLEDERWVQRSDQPNQHRSALAVPLMMGEESLGVLLLYHRQPNRFDSGQLDLVTATAKQIAVAINNAQLYNLIRNQAEQLGDMLRTQHIETSRSQAILEAVADGVLVTDANREITLFNVSAESILGLDRFDVLGRSLEHFIGLFGKAGQAWVQTIRTWSDDPMSYRPGESYAEQIELDERKVVAVHLSPVLLRSDFLGTVSIFRDITHMIEVDRLKSEFVATVSHELRTPLTSIKGYVEIMLMGAAGSLSEQQAHFLQVVKSNTERLAILVNDLLDISRIEAGRVSLSFQPLDFFKITNQAVETITQRMQDEKRPMTVETDLQPNLPVALGDQERVQQILDNLVENAYQYTPEGGKILIRVFQAGNDVQFDVKDNGIGILLEDQPHVFERFFRGEDPLVLATSGTGLGLSIVRHLVEMHRGRIWFESVGAPGLGTVFSFTIPIDTTNGTAVEATENKEANDDDIIS